MKNNFFFFFLFFCFKYCLADTEISSEIIYENCISCHSEKLTNKSYLGSLKNLEKDYFLQKMLEYKNDKSDSVMKRIVKPLLIDDIIKLGNFIYEDQQK